MLIREQSIKLTCLLQLNAPITILFSKTPHKLIKINSFSAFWFNAEYSQTWPSLLCHCRPQIPYLIPSVLGSECFSFCAVPFKWNLRQSYFHARARDGGGVTRRASCAAFTCTRTLETFSHKCPMSHNFSFKTKLPTGVAAGVARPILRVAVATPVGETRLLATVQMQLDELLTLALTQTRWKRRDTHFSHPHSAKTRPAMPLIRRLLVGGKNADGMLNVIGPKRWQTHTDSGTVWHAERCLQWT